MIESIGSFLADSRGIYLGIALFGSAVFVVQFILSLVGLHGGDGADSFEIHTGADADIHDVSIFSVKSIVAFLAFFGWGGYFWGHLGWGGLGIAFVCGAFMMAVSVLMIWGLLRLQQSGNLAETDFVGKRGTVYLSIPPGRAAGGMITVIFPDRTRQVAARADEALKTGEDVEIESSLGGDIYLVRRAVSKAS